MDEEEAPKPLSWEWVGLSVEEFIALNPCIQDSLASSEIIPTDTPPNYKKIVVFEHGG